MPRIFLTLAILSTIVLVTTFGLGLSIGDPTVREAAVQDRVTYHFLTALLALVFATLVHAIVLTYFMGTGRWIEETSRAYSLEEAFFQKNRRLKYRTIPLMVLAVALLIATGAIGAAVDPASPVRFGGWFGLPGNTIHLLAAATTLAVNFIVNWQEYEALSSNVETIKEVLAEVRKMREERGLPV